jgi:hypothetical protein
MDPIHPRDKEVSKTAKATFPNNRRPLGIRRTVTYRNIVPPELPAISVSFKVCGKALERDSTGQLKMWPAGLRAEVHRNWLLGVAAKCLNCFESHFRMHLCTAIKANTTNHHSADCTVEAAGSPYADLQLSDPDHKSSYRAKFSYGDPTNILDSLEALLPTRTSLPLSD